MQYPAQTGSTFQGGWFGILPWLLPYIEQNNLYNIMCQPQQLSPNLNFATYVTQMSPWWNYGNWVQAAQYKVKTFLCPSDSPDAPLQGTFIAFVSQPGNLTGWYFANPFGATLGKSNYLGTGGYQDFVQPINSGVFYPASTNKVSVIPDGTAYTTFFGESLGDQLTAPRNFSIGWMGSTNLCSYFTVTPPYSSFPYGWYDFTSRHTSVINFAFGDGTVRPIKQNADRLSFIYATGMQDGQVYNMSGIGQ